MTPVLVDTSIWRIYFSGNATTKRLGDLLDEDGAVLIHPFVVGELVLGGLATREEALLARLPAAPIVAHGEVLALVRQRKLTGRGIGWIDAHLLASALTSGAAVWTADTDLSSAAAAVGVAGEFVPD